MYAELLKVKNNPLALLLLALGPLAVGLIFALQGSQTLQVELQGGLESLWAVPMHLSAVLFLPYLLTLERRYETEKWLWTTPTRPWQTLLHKWGLSVLLGAGLGLLSMGLVRGSFDGGLYLHELAVMLSTSLTFTALSLALGSFAGVLVAAVAWSTVSGYLPALLPEALRGPLAAMLPGLSLSDWAGGEFTALRVLAHALLLALTAGLLRGRGPRW